jgi:hypothetical protein
MATQAQIAEHLDLSERRVRDLVVEGVLQKGADLDQCRVSYIRYLRGGASGKHTGAGLKLTDERARPCHSGFSISLPHSLSSSTAIPTS